MHSSQKLEIFNLIFVKKKKGSPCKKLLQELKDMATVSQVSEMHSSFVISTLLCGQNQSKEICWESVLNSTNLDTSSIWVMVVLLELNNIKLQFYDTLAFSIPFENRR